MNRPLPSLPVDVGDFDVAALSDTAAHAAVTALTVAAHSCPDPIRAQSARVLFSLVEPAGAGDGAPARRRASTLATLVHCAATVDPATVPLLHAAERWFLHPGRDSSAALTAAAAALAPTLPMEVLRASWACGAGLERALTVVDRDGIDGAPPTVLGAVAEASQSVVPVLWLAQRCGTSRDGLHRRIRQLLDRSAEDGR